MRSWCLFWRDESSHVACCQFADDDEIVAEPDAFNCTTCPVAAAEADLWPENVTAWGVYQQLASPFVMQAGLSAEVFRAVTADDEASERLALVDRLSVIHELVSPPPPKGP